MTRRMLRSSICLLALAAAACGPGPTAGSAVSSVEVTLKDATVPAGISTEISAIARLSDGRTKDVTTLARWSTSDQAKALAACTTSPCPVTTISAGAVTFTATYAGISATAQLTVTAASLKTITVNASQTSIAKGATAVLSAVAQFTDASAMDISSQVTWTSSDTSVLTIAGTLATGAGVGNATVSAALSGVTGTLPIAVTAAAPQSLTLSPTPLTVPVGATRQMVALLTYTDGSSADVAATATWTTSDAAVAAVSTTGEVHALAQGTATISATSGGLTASETVNVGAPTVVSISITPSPLALLVGGTQQLTATALLSDSSTMNVTSSATWGTSAATVATVNASGLLSAVAAGTAEVEATLGDVTGTAAVTVTPIVITSIEVTPMTTTLPLGSQQQLQATAHMNDNSSMDVTATVAWSSASATEVLVSAGGLVTASARTTSPVTVTATVGDVSGTATVSVTDPVLESLSITPSAPAVAAGLTVALTLTGTLTDDTTEDDTALATWTSGDTDIATVDASGVVTGVIDGSVSITATYGSFSASVTVMVSPPVISSITVSPDTVTLPLGHTRQLVVNATLSNGDHTTVTAQTTWSSDDPDGLIATISATGLVQTVAVNATPVTFTATAGGKTATAVVTVAAPVVESITVSPATVSLAAGRTQALTVTGHLSDGNTEDDTTGATWTSSDDDGTYAIVSATGVVTAVSPTTTPVTFTAHYGGQTATTSVTVTAAVPTSIEIKPATLSLHLGASSQLVLQASMSDGRSEDLAASATWETSDASVVSISASGVVKGESESATGATITATLGELTATAVVTVGPAVVSSLAVEPSPVSVALGLTQQLAAISTFTDGHTENYTLLVDWTSGEDAVATVSDEGLVTAVAEGTTTLHVAYGSASADVPVTVTPAVVTSLTLEAPQTRLPPGLTEALKATGHFSDGSSQDVTSSVTWSVDDSSVATIDAGGVLTAVSAGQVVVTAQSGTVTQTLTLDVTNSIVSLSFQPGPTISVPKDLTVSVRTIATLSDDSTLDVSSLAVWSTGDTTGTVTVTPSGSITAVGSDGVAVPLTATVSGVQGTLDVKPVKSMLWLIPQAKSPYLHIGLTTSISVSAQLEDFSEADVTAFATWTTDDPGETIARRRGLLVTGIGAGTAVFTAHVGDQTKNLTIDVPASTLDSLYYPSIDSYGTTAGRSGVQMRIGGRFSDGDEVELTGMTDVLTWSSSDSARVPVTEAGEFSTLAITSPDVITITVTATVAGVTRTGEFSVEVVAGPLLSITLTPADQHVAINQTEQLAADGLYWIYSDPTHQDLTATATWTSSDSSVATVDSSGLVTCVGAGTATISASAPNFNGSFVSITGTTTVICDS